MATFDTLDSLTGVLRYAVADLLYRMADDELLMGYCDAEWTSAESIPDQYAAFPLMDRDEREHARAYYRMLHDLGQPDLPTLVMDRDRRAFRCASLVCLPTKDQPFSIIRRFLYDAQESVRLMALRGSTLTPLAELARTLHEQEREHLAHTRRWIFGLGDSGAQGRDKMQEVLHFIYPHALGLFEPTEADNPLAESGICPREDQLRREWESAVVPVLGGVGLSIPENMEPVHGGRVGKHPPALEKLLVNVRTRFDVGVPGG